MRDSIALPRGFFSHVLAGTVGPLSVTGRKNILVEVKIFGGRFINQEHQLRC